MIAAGNETGRHSQAAALDMGDWLGLAASPTFAVMAWIAATDTPQSMICSSVPGVPLIGGMAWMYLLMSLFHLSPWLRLISGRQWRLTYPVTYTEGDRR